MFFKHDFRLSSPQIDSSERVQEFAKQHDHPKLWRLLAEHALLQRMFSVAEDAYVHIKDYARLMFVKRVQKITDLNLQRAEIQAYQFKKFAEAEQIYVENDRLDLAISLRRKIGDWTRVIQFLQSGDGDDATYADAYSEIAEHFQSQQK